MSIIAQAGGTQVLQGSISLDNISPPVLNADTNDYNPANLQFVSSLFLKASAAINLTGLTTGGQGRELTLVNIGAFDITLKNLTGSAAGNQFNFGSDITLLANAVNKITVFYVSGAWTTQAGIGSSGGAMFQNAVLTPPALAAGTTNNYAPTGFASVNRLRLTPDAGGSSLSGVAGGANGRTIEVVNLGAANLTFLHQNAGSLSANRFICPSDVDLVVPLDTKVEWWYDPVSLAWRLGDYQPATAVTSSANYTVTDSVNPFYDLTNTAADTDKKRWRHYVDTIGTYHFAAISDDGLTLHDIFNISRAANNGFNFLFALALGGKFTFNNPLSASDDFNLSAAFYSNGISSPSALASGSTNDYSPAGLGGVSNIRLTPDSSLGSTLTGLQFQNLGAQLTLFNIQTGATGNLTLAHQNAGSIANNRFICPGETDLIIPAGGSATLWYDNSSTRWRVKN